MDDYHNKRQIAGVYQNPPQIDRNKTDLATGQIDVTSTPKQLNYVSLKRVATKITNLSATVEIFYGATAGVTVLSGDFIAAGRGQWVSIPAQSVIWVVCAAGQTARAAWADAYE